MSTAIMPLQLCASDVFFNRHVKLKTAEQRTIIQQYSDCYTGWLLMDGLLHSVQQGGASIKLLSFNCICVDMGQAA